MDLPAGYELRAPTANELDAVVAVVIAEELNDGGQIMLGADFVQGEWSRVGDLATDAWLARLRHSGSATRSMRATMPLRRCSAPVASDRFITSGTCRST